MEYKILGISGSPVKEGNVETYLRRMIESVKDKNISREIVNLSKLEIKDCIQCNYCLTKQKAHRYCSIKDEAQDIFEKAEAADIIVLASPVYFMRTSARMAAFIDRLRIFAFGNLVKGKMRNKIGVSAAVSWLRQGGLETTHLSHIYAFMTLEMIPVGSHKGVSLLGASAVASIHGSGDFNPAVRLGVEEDKLGLHSARTVMKRAVELARLMKK